jgi:signal recognition particle subunit SRP72
LGRDVFAEEGLSEAEIKDELASVLVQQAYVLQSQEQLDRAHGLYTQVLQSKPSDQAVLATASNNLISLRKQDEKMFDSLKRSEKAVSVDEEKLSTRQKRAIHLNRCLLLMYGKRGDQSQALVETLQKEFPNSEIPALVQASLYFREKAFDKCTTVLQVHHIISLSLPLNVVDHCNIIDCMI